MTIVSGGVHGGFVVQVLQKMQTQLTLIMANVFVNVHIYMCTPPKIMRYGTSKICA